MEADADQPDVPARGADQALQPERAPRGVLPVQRLNACENLLTSSAEKPDESRDVRARVDPRRMGILGADVVELATVGGEL